jgi:hypothetical protein
MWSLASLSRTLGCMWRTSEVRAEKGFAKSHQAVARAEQTTVPPAAGRSANLLRRRRQRRPGPGDHNEGRSRDGSPPIAWTVALCCHSLDLLAHEFQLKLDRADVADRRVPATRVVEPIDGSRPRCLRFAAFLPALRGRTATQDSLPAGGQPFPDGLVTRKVPNEVSAVSTWLPPHPSFPNASERRDGRAS